MAFVERSGRFADHAASQGGAGATKKAAQDARAASCVA